MAQITRVFTNKIWISLSSLCAIHCFKSIFSPQKRPRFAFRFPLLSPWAAPFHVWFLVFIFSLSTSETKAQRPNGYFLTDSVEIGRPFRYAFSFRHRPDVEVFFPDTTHNFAPFEIISHEYFPTQTDSRGSLDSAVYTLVSFEMAKMQALKLPVWVLTRRDCTAVYSDLDSIPLHELVQGVINQQKLKIDNTVFPLRRQINFPLILLIAFSILLVGSVIYLGFGEALQRQWRLYQLFRRNLEFVRNFNRLARTGRGKDNIQNVEQATILWKKYLQRLEKKPFDTYTTKEITDSLPDESLFNALREIDGVIYGGVSSSKTKTAESLEILRQIATQTYRRRRTTVAQVKRKPA